MAALEADADFQILLLRFFGGSENFADAGSINGNGLFHEHVLALSDSFFEMNRTKTRWRGDDNNVGRSDRLFVTVETNELAVLRYVDLFFMLVLKIVEAVTQFVRERIAHGHKLGRPTGAKSLVGSAGTTSATTNQ